MREIRKLGPGERILDYRILERLGQGGFGEVFRAEHEALGRIVAIKVPHSLEAVSALRREARIQHQLDHPSIVKTLELSVSFDPPYFVMEHVAGRSLRAVAAGQPMPWRRVARWIAELCEALDFAHRRGVVHGDVTPSNILVPDDPTEPIKLTDFGLSQEAGGGHEEGLEISQSLTLVSARVVQGTLAYMAPEQRNGDGATVAADVFAVGVVLFELLTGERPIGFEVPSELCPGLPRSFDALFRRCYARPEQRVERLSELASTLRELLAEGGAASPRESHEVASKGRADRGGRVPVGAPAQVHLDLELLPGQRDARVVKLPRGFCVDALESLAAQLEALQSRGLRWLICDMSRLERRESEILGELVSIAERLRLTGGGVVLYGASTAACVALEILGFSVLFEVAESKLEACELIAMRSSADEGEFGASLPTRAKAPRVAADAEHRSPSCDVSSRSSMAALDGLGVAEWARHAAAPEGRVRSTSRCGYDAAFVAALSDEPQHRVYVREFECFDAEVAGAELARAERVFDDGKGLWEKEITFIFVVSELRERKRVDRLMRRFTSGWWRRRRALIYVFGDELIIAERYGCKPRDNGVKRFVLDELGGLSAARSQRQAAVQRAALTKSAWSDGRFGTALTLVSTVFLIAAGLVFNEHHQRGPGHRRQGPQARSLGAQRAGSLGAIRPGARVRLATLQRAEERSAEVAPASVRRSPPRRLVTPERRVD
jgi:anti-anti-sigma regulatory factor